MLIVFGQQYQTHSDDKCRDKEKVTLADGYYKHPLNNVFKSMQIYFKNVDFLTLFSSLYIKVAK